ncbi:efflux RND transporter permease subunit [Teredinibacter purpureus]|uniref:efflux RND transporter permease subunit n=1 Tax=Teredinibacter purpureus TaxID=2731756 RepID=UPI0009E5C5BB|nr:MMPL family transporter [Teredinibacter purpureus]
MSMSPTLTNRPLVERYANFVIRYRWLVILLSLLFVFSLMSGMPKFGFDQDYRVFFSDENPHLKAFDKQQQIYTKNDNVLIAITPNSGSVFTPDVLAAVEHATRTSWTLPFVLRVDSISNFQYSHAEEDELIVEDLIENARSLTPETIANIKNIALSEPLLKGQLVNHEGTVTALNITFEMPQVSPETELPLLVEAIRELQTSLEQNYPVTIQLSGVVMLSNAFFEASMQDQMTLVPAMYLLVLVICGVLLRSFGATAGTFLVVFFSMLSALGGFFWLGGKLTPPSFAATTIITTLAVADSIHFLVTLFDGMRKGMNRHDAIRHSLRLNISPIFLTSLTTAVGFLSMNFSDTPPFHDLGNITAFGVAIAFILSVTLLPAFIAVVPVRSHKTGGYIAGMLGKLAELVITRQKTIFISTALMSIVVVSGIGLNTFDDNFVGYFDESIEFRQDTDYINDNLTGIYQIQYSLDAGEDYGVSHPVFLKKVDDFVQWYRTQPEVTHVNTFTDTFKRLNKNMHNEDKAYYTLPEDKALAAQYLLLYELSLPEGLDLNNQMDIGKSSTQVIVTLRNSGSKTIANVAERGRNWLKDNNGFDSYGVGPAVMFAHISATNMKSMFLSSFIAILIISLIITVALRSTRLGILSLIPNLLPISLAFGLWGFFIAEVNVAVSMVTGMALGIVVDDTVHFLSKYLRARREDGMNAEDAIRYAFNSVGIALVVTSIILVGGFMILAQSSFGMNSAMAQLTSIAITVALIIDLLLLPVLLIKLDKTDYTTAYAAQQNGPIPTELSEKHYV